jgi:prepilin-type N-terminal cleavage/methylation domain-containing protein
MAATCQGQSMPRSTEAFGARHKCRHPARQSPDPRRSMAGLTLLEVLLAVAILSIALLGLAAAITSDFGGIRREGQVTATNQAAVQVIELYRSEILARPDNFDGGRPQDSDSIEVDGVEYSYTYEITALRAASNGELLPASGDPPHVFDVRVSIAVPRAAARTYATLVVRRP